jgi:hypothetical protein
MESNIKPAIDSLPEYFIAGKKFHHYQEKRKSDQCADKEKN